MINVIENAGCFGRLNSRGIDGLNRALLLFRQPRGRRGLVPLTTKGTTRPRLRGVGLVALIGSRNFRLFLLGRERGVSGFFNRDFCLSLGRVLGFRFGENLVAFFLIARGHSSGDALFIFLIPSGFVSLAGVDCLHEPPPLVREGFDGATAQFFRGLERVSVTQREALSDYGEALDAHRLAHNVAA